MKRGEGFRHQVHDFRFRRSDAHTPRHILVFSGKFLLGLVDEGKDFHRALLQPHALLGEQRATVGPHEEFRVELVLEIGDLTRQRRLGDVKDIRCLRHVFVLGHL